MTLKYKDLNLSGRALGGLRAAGYGDPRDLMKVFESDLIGRDRKRLEGFLTSLDGVGKATASKVAYRLDWDQQETDPVVALVSEKLDDIVRRKASYKNLTEAKDEASEDDSGGSAEVQDLPQDGPVFVFDQNDPPGIHQLHVRDEPAPAADLPVEDGPVPQESLPAPDVWDSDGSPLTLLTALDIPEGDFRRNYAIQIWESVNQLAVSAAMAMFSGGKYSVSEIPELAWKYAMTHRRMSKGFSETLDLDTFVPTGVEGMDEPHTESPEEREARLLSEGYTKDPDGNFRMHPVKESVQDQQDAVKALRDRMHAQGMVFNSSTGKWVPRPPEQVAAMDEPVESGPMELPVDLPAEGPPVTWVPGEEY